MNNGTTLFDENKVYWNGDHWEAYVRCPVCGNKIGED